MLNEFNIKYTTIDTINTDNIPTLISHFKIKCGYQNVDNMIPDLLKVHCNKSQKSIVFCSTQVMVGNVMDLCRNISIKCDILHGGLTQKQREITMNNFRQNNINCLITTDVCSRGIDLPDLDTVIQVEPPQTVESYIHRSGRSGRVNRKGKSIIIYNRNNEYLLNKIER